MNYLNKTCPLYLLIILSLCVSCQKGLYQDAPDIYLEDSTFKVVGYLSAGSFEFIDQIELNRLTHLNLAFANPDADGNLVFRQGKDLSEVVEKAHAKGVKVLVSIAGGGIRDDDKVYWKKVLKPANRNAFIEKIVAFVEKNKLDGVDVDIEGNLFPTIGKSYNPFVRDLKKALHAKGKAITAALPGAWLHEAVRQETLEAYDFINVMVYDDTGPWNPEKAGPHAPYSFAERSVSFWLNQKKLPRSRLVLGMPFYGYDFEVIGSQHYSQIVENNVADAYKDEVGQLYYNGIPTIVKKTQLAMEKCNGVMFWELAQDAFNDLSLLRAVDQVIKTGNCAGGTLSTYFGDLDGDGFGDLAKPIQACAPPEGYVANHQDEDDTHAAIHPGAAESQFKVIAFYTARNDQAHISFVHEANKWFSDMAAHHHFTYDSTHNWNNLNAEYLSQYQVVIFLDTRPDDPAQRAAFRQYMEHGGAWMGFHFAGFALTPSDYPQNWDWYHQQFLGAGQYVSNTWRPTSAVLRVEDSNHPATQHLPQTFRSSPNEWYRWENDLRKNHAIKILLSIDSTSFPLGTGPKPHEIWHSGYYPVVWTNTHYKMLYVNMGHNDMDYEHKTNKTLSFTFHHEIQDQLILDGLLWLGNGKKAASVNSDQ